MKKIDKLKKQRYEVSMKIIELESKLHVSKLNKNEEKELEILRQKEADLNERIENI